LIFKLMIDDFKKFFTGCSIINQQFKN